MLDDYSKYAKPVLDRNFAKTKNSEFIYKTETGHRLTVDVPVPGNEEEQQWTMQIAHPNSSKNRMMAHREPLGNDPSKLESRMEEFMTGQKGMDILRKQQSGNYTSSRFMLYDNS